MPAEQKSKTEARKTPVAVHACGWQAEIFSSVVIGKIHVVMTFAQSEHRSRRGSNGNRLFPWHTILLARSSVLYLLRPWVPEGVPLAGCGITYGTAGSGRDRPAHRQRPAVVRKRTERNLRAVISEKILFRPGRRRYIKSLVPAAADKHVFQ